jgi:uncharacterized protein YjdB
MRATLSHPVSLAQVPQQLHQSSSSQQQQQQQQSAAAAAARSSKQQRKQQRKRRQPRSWLSVELRRPVAALGSKGWLQAEAMATTDISS